MCGVCGRLDDVDRGRMLDRYGRDIGTTNRWGVRHRGGGCCGVAGGGGGVASPSLSLYRLDGAFVHHCRTSLRHNHRGVVDDQHRQQLHISAQPTIQLGQRDVAAARLTSRGGQADRAEKRCRPVDDGGVGAGSAGCPSSRWGDRRRDVVVDPRGRQRADRDERGEFGRAAGHLTHLTQMSLPGRRRCAYCGCATPVNVTGWASDQAEEEPPCR